MWKDLENHNCIYSGKLIEFGQPSGGTSIEWEIYDKVIAKNKYWSGIYFYVYNSTYGKYKFYLPSWKLNDNQSHTVYFSNDDKKYLTIISF